MNENNYKAYKKIRKTWDINPKTRIVKSNKVYNRNKAKKDLKNFIREELDE